MLSVSFRGSFIQFHLGGDGGESRGVLPNHQPCYICTPHMFTPHHAIIYQSYHIIIPTTRGLILRDQAAERLPEPNQTEKTVLIYMRLFGFVFVPTNVPTNEQTCVRMVWRACQHPPHYMPCTNGFDNMVAVMLVHACFVSVQVWWQAPRAAAGTGSSLVVTILN